MNVNIILLGYMGCGKSTLGKGLSRRLNLQFIDTDQLIEQQEKCSISFIFEHFGEAYFRMLEQQMIEQLHGKENLLIATGGGLPCYNNLMATLNKMGVTIYLQRSTKELAHRIFHSRQDRPIVKGKTIEELTFLIDNMLQIRSPYYLQSHIIARRNEQNVASLSQVITHYLSKTN